MKPQQLAMLLNIAPNTLRRWAGKDYSEFLSPTAQGNGSHRSFNQQDARIIAWVVLMKSQNTSAVDIRATLKSAQAENWGGLPELPGGLANDEPIAVVPREAVEERLRALSERYETQLTSVVRERDYLQIQLQEKQHELETARFEASDSVKSIQKETSVAINTLQQRIIELTGKEAELRGRLEQYMIGGRRLSAVTLAIAALVIGAGVMLLALLAIQVASRR
jgi:DNA-binding transcriptional MerR regulator